METTNDQRMQEALRLARAGEQEQARQLIIDIINQDRDNFDAWMAMTQVTYDHREAIASVKQALRLQPDDLRAQRYLDYLLEEEQQVSDVSSNATKASSRWPLVTFGVTVLILLAIASIFFLFRPEARELLLPTSQPRTVSDVQPLANEPSDCSVLINEALEVSNQGCQQLGRNEVCYGHDTIEAQLVPGTNANFEQPGNIIPVNLLQSFQASPLDQQRAEWGVGVFRLEANLPGTLPGQLVTILVFGNTTLQNVSGDMQAFYFSSGLGGMTCDVVPFDGILLRTADNAGYVFKANGTDIALQGNSILQATANKSLTLTVLSGTGTVRALGQQQTLTGAQTVSVPMGGQSGLEASGPPSPPQSADTRVLASDCTLTGTGCPLQPAGDPQSILNPNDNEPTAQNTPVPPRRPRPTRTSTPTPVPTTTPTPFPTKPGDPPRPTPIPPQPTSTPKPTVEPTPTQEPNTETPTMEPTPEPTTEPPSTTEPAPTP